MDRKGYTIEHRFEPNMDAMVAALRYVLYDCEIGKGTEASEDTHVRHETDGAISVSAAQLD